MEDPSGGTQDRVLSVRLHLRLDRSPISGWLHTDEGTDEHFVGWLGFVETLQRLHGPQAAAAAIDVDAPPTTEEEHHG